MLNNKLNSFLISFPLKMFLMHFLKVRLFQNTDKILIRIVLYLPFPVKHVLLLYAEYQQHINML